VDVVIGSSFLPGQVKAVVTIDGVKKESDPFVMVAPCAGKCGSHGICSDSTGKCSCSAGYSGSQCDVSACASKGCNPLASQCVIFGGAARCTCAAGFEGPLCYGVTAGSPCSGKAACVNDGVRSVFLGATQAPVCGDCVCRNSFSGPTCNSCGLTGQCLNGGAPSADCSSCVCKEGFNGEKCTCRNAVVKLIFGNMAWTITASADAMADFKSDLEKTFKGLMLSETVFATVASIKGYNTTTGGYSARVTVNVGATCNSPSDTSVLEVSDDPNAGAMFDIYAALDNLKTGLSSSSSTLPPALGSMDTSNIGVSDPQCSQNCPQNVGAGDVDPTEVVPPTDPTDPEPPADDSSSGLSKDEKIAVGVVVGVGGFLIILAIVLAWKFGCCCFSKTTTTKSEGVEMGTYDV